jgi:hypothetical protein
MLPQDGIYRVQVFFSDKEFDSSYMLVAQLEAANKM